jgi:hypothetical protein
MPHRCQIMHTLTYVKTKQTIIGSFFVGAIENGTKHVNITK